MRATLNIPDELMARVSNLSREKSKTRAIIAAMESYVRSKGREEVRALRGRIRIEFDWEKAEGEELAAQFERERSVEARR